MHSDSTKSAFDVGQLRRAADAVQHFFDMSPDMVKTRAAVAELMRGAADTIERLQGKYTELSRSHDAIERLMRENASWQQERVTRAMTFKDAVREAFEEYEESGDPDSDSMLVGAIREILNAK